jgi:hypothetical protein
MIDHTVVKLGRRPARHDPRTLQFARYLTAGVLPRIPSSKSWSTAVRQPWGMMLNDSLGDCTCAAAGHMVQCWTANHGAEVTPTDKAILSAYEAVGGYRPGHPDTDNGAVEIDVLNYWRKTGIAGHQLAAYAAVAVTNVGHVKAGLDLFGGLYIGLSLPLSAQGQQVWTVPAGGAHGRGVPGSWGGHAVGLVAFDATGLTCVTWGALQKMSWGFFGTYCEEAYVPLSNDWARPGVKAPSGFDLAALQADLKLVTG